MRREHGALLRTLTALIVFAAAFFPIFAAARSANDRLTNGLTESEQARVAVNYALTAMRANDRTGAINVRELPNSEKTALVIYSDIGGEMSAEWIFFADGLLRSYKTAVGDLAFEEKDGAIISPVKHFSAALTENGTGVNIAAAYTLNGAERNMEAVFVPRTTIN